MPEENEVTKLELTFNEETNEVVATFTPGTKPLKASAGYIQEQITEHGFNEYLANDAEIKILVELINTKTACSHVVAKKTDAILEIWVSHDAMRVYVTHEPAHGGVNLTAEQVSEKFSEEGIEVPLNTSILEKITMGKLLKNELIAEGKPAIKPLTIFERQYIKQSSAISHVEQGTPLLKRVRKKIAKAGKDVFGNTIKPIPDALKHFAENAIGTEVSEENKKILISKEPGHPVFFNNFVKIDNPVEYSTLNKKSNHKVFHDGSVFINGDVGEQVVIEASGDIIINGVVGGADIKAGGDILIQQGVIGGTLKNNALQNDLATHNRGAKLTAKGQVIADFLDNALIQSGKDVLIKEYICHCTVYSDENIYVGQNEGAGKIIGGSLHARMNIKANIVGTSGHSPCELIIQKLKRTEDAIEKMRTSLVHQDIKLNATRTALAQLDVSTKSMPPASVKAMKEPLILDIETLIGKLSEDILEYESLISFAFESSTATVIAKEKIFGGVTVKIQEHLENILQDTDAIEVKLTNDHISTSSL